MKAWLREMERCSFKLLEAFCLGLGLPAEALHPVFQRDHTSMCRLNRYPVTPDDGQNRFGVHHHTGERVGAGVGGAGYVGWGWGGVCVRVCEVGWGGSGGAGG